MPSGEHPAGGGGAENPCQGGEQSGGRLRVCWGCASQRSGGDRHQVLGPQRPDLGIIKDGVSEGVQKTLPLFPSHVAIKLFEK